MTSGLSVSFLPLLLLPLTLQHGWHGQYEARTRKSLGLCILQSLTFTAWPLHLPVLTEQPAVLLSILGSSPGTALFPLLHPGLQGCGTQRDSGGSVPAVSLSAGSSSVEVFARALLWKIRKLQHFHLLPSWDSTNSLSCLSDCSQVVFGMLQSPGV